MSTTRTESEPFETVGEQAQGPRRLRHRRHARHRRRHLPQPGRSGRRRRRRLQPRRERAEAFQAELSKDEIPVSIHQGNVGSAEDCRRTVQEVIDHHGRLDILVNNAGITSTRRSSR